MNRKFLTSMALLLAGCSGLHENIPVPKVSNKTYSISELKEKLKDNKFNIDALYEDDKGGYFCLLSKAAGQNDFELVKFLVANGANIDGIRYGSQNASPILSTENLQIAEFLLQHGADANATDGMADVGALFQAASRGNSGMVRLLLKYNADVNKKICNGGCGTPLHAACNAPNLDQVLAPMPANAQYLEVVKLLVQHGANVNEIDTYGESPLSMAQRSGNKKIVQFLERNIKKRKP